MKLPRPLLIVLIILLVLFVVSCGIGIARSGEQSQGDGDKKSELRDGDFASFFKRFGPPSAPVEFPTASAPCRDASTGNLNVSGSCTVTIPSTNDPRRRLLLRPAAGFMTMSVAVTRPIDPAPLTETNSDSTTISSNSDEGSVVVVRGESAVVTVGCNCTVLVNPAELN